MFDLLAGTMDAVAKIIFTVLLVAAIALPIRWAVRRFSHNMDGDITPSRRIMRDAQRAEWKRLAVLYDLYLDGGGEKDRTQWRVDIEPTLIHNPGNRAKAHLAYADYRVSGGDLDFLTWAKTLWVPANPESANNTEAPPTPERPPARNANVRSETRLRVLMRLHDEGLITDVEYEEKRQTVLDGL